MEIEKFEIEGPLLIKPKLFNDERGNFFECYSELIYKASGIDFHFVQDNQSRSSLHVLRGLHFQNPPWEQGKLVRVAYGKALDVAVDIRPSSPTFGQHIKVILDDQSSHLFWIPPGFAHGFLALEDQTTFVYKCTNYYNKESESGVLWNDPLLNIQWGIEKPIVSEKDLHLNGFDQLFNLSNK